jgi:hypothetical protein
MEVTGGMFHSTMKKRGSYGPHPILIFHVETPYSSSVLCVGHRACATRFYLTHKKRKNVAQQQCSEYVDPFLVGRTRRPFFILFFSRTLNMSFRLSRDGGFVALLIKAILQVFSHTKGHFAFTTFFFHL